MSERSLRGTLPLYARVRSWILLPVGVALLILTLTLGLVAKSFGSSGPDIGVDVGLSEIRNPLLNALAVGVHVGLGPVGAVIILGVICVWLLFVRRAPLQSFAFGSITAVGWLSSEIGKFTVGRLRPPAVLVHPLVIESGRDSFPSGHTAFAASLSLAIILVLTRPGMWRRWIIFAGVIFTVLVALSRLYLGVHYVSDVVGSVLISGAGVLMWLVLWNAFIEPRLDNSRLLARFTSTTSLT
ncbi:phosphatase PAP2 family protein [Pseudarthrobacter sp. PS3-L1]|uniref:phosphatase PAP2 family protein n=1 Tax=Pseudarthrobacter sp. PS3-L1 TaxID=3046207 RepID=UPI0024B8BB20|nr:phosphatase PAP2 family protein [Pseudarthrobacter sp. PS3-L1]MDJ0319932.1 phosphatase PAP2 family protein [Pseudarthrobacter sp. PS3-L1]